MIAEIMDRRAFSTALLPLRLSLISQPDDIDGLILEAAGGRA